MEMLQIIIFYFRVLFKLIHLEKEQNHMDGKNEKRKKKQVRIAPRFDNLTFFCSLKKQFWADGMSQVVEGLPSKHEALNSNPRSAK
jgi:hypothetical protein